MLCLQRVWKQLFVHRKFNKSPFVPPLIKGIGGICMLGLILLFFTGTNTFSQEKSSENKPVSSELRNQVTELEKENQKLRQLLEEQNKILTRIAEMKIFTDQIWQPIKREIIDLITRVETRAGTLKKERGVPMPQFKIYSLAFTDGEMIPKKYTCDGVNVSPPLKWENLPSGTKSIVLINDDPDAPVGTWVHWLVFNIPPTVTELPENVPPVPVWENGIRQGNTDFRRIGYGGPCPPSGTHRYFFKLYALNTELSLNPGVTKSQIIKAMEGHILGECQLIGKYKR